MKIWITRSNAMSVSFKGLKAIDVWFTRPRWYSNLILWQDHPITKSKTYEMCWLVESAGNNETMWVSFTSMFGSGDSGDKDTDEFVLHVWDKICEHFKTTDASKFEDSEEKGITVKNFILEFDLSVKLTQKA